ncbi:MAG: murein biosynthesis integral membrane protein MurJ [Gammaproteobacteria bacterium]|nr:murein biosynthesis integral membrane protein MurJ [Gammaproteobacteria bacterium]
MSNDTSTSSEIDSQQIAISGSVVAGLTAVSRVSGLVRDIMFSFFFGAGPFADAFYVAFRIPNLFRRLVAEGAFAQAFVPVLTEYQTHNTRKELHDFVGYVSGAYLTAISALCVLGVLAAPYLITLFTFGGWSGDLRHQAGTEMLRIMFPYLGLISLTAFAGAILNSYQRFAIPAATPILLNVSLIIAVVLGSSYSFNIGIALALGVVVAGALQLLAHVPTLVNLKMLVLPKISLKHSGVTEVFRRLGPGVYAASAGQINILVGTIVASQCVVGSVSWLYYADRLIELPVGIVAIALQTVLLPNLSRLIQRDQLAEFRQTLDWGFRLGIVLGLPASVALFLIAEALIATFFMHGAFDETDLVMCRVALQVFAIGVIPMVLTRVAAPGYFARGDTKTPFKYATVGVAVNVVISIVSYRWLGLAGIAYATSVAAIIHCLLLVRGLTLDGMFKPSREFWKVLGASVVACAAMSFFLLLIAGDTDFWTAKATLERILWLAFLVSGGFVLYTVGLLVCGIRLTHLLNRN